MRKIARLRRLNNNGASFNIPAETKLSPEALLLGLQKKAFNPKLLQLMNNYMFKRPLKFMPAKNILS